MIMGTQFVTALGAEGSRKKKNDLFRYIICL